MDDQQKTTAALRVVKAVTDAVREAGEIPCGTLYAGLMTQGCTLRQYETLESLLLSTGRITKRHNCLIWTKEETNHDAVAANA